MPLERGVDAIEQFKNVIIVVIFPLGLRLDSWEFVCI